MKSIITSVNPNLIVYSDSGISQYKDFQTYITPMLNPEIKKISPFIYQESIVSFHGKTSAIYIRAIDGEHSVSAEKISKLVSPQGAFSSINNASNADLPNIILGTELANSLGAKVGDRVTLMKFVGDSSQIQNLPLQVTGIVHIGISQYDKQYGLMNFYDGQKLFGTSQWASGLEVNLVHPETALELAKKLNADLPYNAVPWQNIDRDLFLQVERDGTSIKLIVLIISLVAGFNIIITLSLTVIDRSKQIALLRSLGAQKYHVIGVFVFSGVILGLVGSTLGVLIGYLVLKLFSGLNIGDFQDFYYLEKIPVHLDFKLILIAFLTSMLLSFLGALYPAWRATQVSPLLGLKN